MFVQTTKGEFINTDYIVSAERSGFESESDVVIVRDADGGVIGKVWKYQWHAMRAAQETVIPASPGYFLLSIPPAADIVDELWEAGDLCFRDPIVGWRGKDAVPVTVDGFDDSESAYAVLCPDGRVIQPYNSTFDSIADFEADLLRRAMELVEHDAKARKAKPKKAA